MALEEIKISWKANPPGQIGKRPRRLKLNDSFKFSSDDPGTLKVEFKNKSPLADGQMVVSAGPEFLAAVPGRFKFKCLLKTPNGQDLVLDPDDPNVPGGGGELEVGP
jgi:hypothetical protein